MDEPIKDIAIQHLSGRVQHAFVQLSDILVEWERSTGRKSVLIYREQDLAPIRLLDGKPGISDKITDQQLLDTLP